MRLPILVAARPKHFRSGATVPLGEGKWHIVTQRVTDTILTMLVDGVPFPSTLTAKSNGHIIQGPCVVHVEFVERGTEEYINVFAESMSGA